ncbi:MAG: ferrous iron transport protein B [Candidatus Hodarchaeota archaeon]
MVGNPNVGKTVIFNALTGSHQHVANFPGCTVEHKEGKCTFIDKAINVIDLPGTYSLSAYSEDETVSREYLINEKPDLVINVIDASNLERNLFLTIQLLELKLPIIIALNMLDIAESKGFKIDIKNIKTRLNVPVIPMIATKGEGIVELLNTVLKYQKDRKIGFFVKGPIKKYEERIADIIRKYDCSDTLANYDYNWLGLKLLERDSIVRGIVNDAVYKESPKNEDIFWNLIKEVIKDFQDKMKVLDTAVYIANERYHLIEDLIDEIIIKRGTASTYITSMLDEVLTDKYLGIPIFLASLWAIFTFTFTLSEPFVFILENIFTVLSSEIKSIIPNPLLVSIISGAIDGVGAILVFVPTIFFLYFAMALLEDSGYLARAAFVVDKWMEKIGLHGKSFIPLMLGFGCTVPAIMATRGIREKEDRLITISIAPFISCSARLPIYVLFAGVFFPDYPGFAILAMYILGIIIAILSAIVLDKFIITHEDRVFIMELPEFQKPKLMVVLREMWSRGSLFIKKAGTIILAAALLVWFLSNIPFGAPMEDTLLAVIGKCLQPIFIPFGWNWEFIAALLLGLVAKEIIIATLGILGEAPLDTFLSSSLTFSQAFPFMVFVLLYIPCFATISVIKAETGSWKITVALVISYIMTAYIIALLFRFLLLFFGFN